MSDKPTKNTHSTRIAEKYPTSKDVKGQFHSQLAIRSRAVRCPGCRAMVVLPCLLCALKGET